MKVFLKWFGIVLGSLLGLAVLVLAVFFFKANAMIGRRYSITPETVTIPTDAASIARGKHFVMAICAGCHTPDLSGQVLIDAPFRAEDLKGRLPAAKS